MADLVLALIILVALLAGWRKGTIRVLAEVGSLVIAYKLARYYSAFFAAHLTGLLPHLQPGSSEEQLLILISLFIDTNAAANRFVQTLLFIIIFVVVNWLVRRLAALLTSLFGFGLLGAVNRAVGAFLSAVLAVVVILILHSIMLPACARMGLDFSGDALAFIGQSQFMLPLIYALPQLLFGSDNYVLTDNGLGGGITGLSKLFGRS